MAGATEQPKLYDLSLLNEMIGDKKEVKKLLKIFLDITPESLNELNKAYTATDVEKMAKSAHKMKASLDTLGIASLHDVIRKLDKPEKIYTFKGNIGAVVKEINITLEKVFVQIRKDHAL
ncbi:MAG: Hpt domain-containing protein [Bacteroidales bacterium]